MARKRSRLDSESPNRVLRSNEPALPDEITLERASQEDAVTLPEAEATEACIAKAHVTQKAKVDDEKNHACKETTQAFLICVESENLRHAQQDITDSVAQSDHQETAVDKDPNINKDSCNKIIGPARLWTERKEQEFDFFLVTDLEWTCTEKDPQPEPGEIWEIATALLNAKRLEIEDIFQTYCRPTVHPILTAFCKEKMNISQDTVDNGKLLEAALDEHILWFLEKGLWGKRYAVVTWSSWDCQIMNSECAHKKMKKPVYFNKWIDLRELWSDLYPEVPRTFPGGLRGRLEYSGLRWEGQEHSARDDAVNTARLAADMIKKGSQLEFNALLNADGKVRYKCYNPGLFD